MSTWNLDLNNEANFVQQDSNKTDINGSIALQPTAYDSYTKLLMHGDSLSDTSNKTFRYNGVGLIPGTGRFTTPAYVSAHIGGNPTPLTIANHSDFDLGVGNEAFTIDCWIYPTQLGIYQAICGRMSATSPYPGYYLHINTANKLEFVSNNNGTAIQSTQTIPINQWTHVAVGSNTGGTGKYLYINGVYQGVNYFNIQNTQVPFYIGHAGSWSPFSGYIDEFRLTKGFARWSNGANFTPPSSPYATDGYTKLLLHFDGDLSDSSGTNKTVNAPQVSATQSKFGGTSLYLNDTFMSTATSADYGFGTGDFTVDCWIYPTVDINTGIDDIRLIAHSGLYATAGNNSWGLCYGHHSSWGAGNRLVFYASIGTTDVSLPPINVTINQNTWTHIAVVRNSGNVKFYINGSSVYSGSYTTNLDTLGGGDLYIGTQPPPMIWKFKGYIDELRISKGIARWTSDFNTQLPTAYVPTAGFSTANPYVTTSATSDFTSVNGNKIDTITINKSEPANTAIKTLVSFDGRATWKYWNVSQWSTSTLANITTNGMTATALQAALTGYVFQAGQTALDIAFSLGTTDTTVTPNISGLSLTYSPNNLPPVAPVINDTTKLNLNTTIQLPAFTDPDGNTLTYSVSGLPNGLSFNPTTRKITGIASQTGQFAITMTANDGNGGVTNQGFLLTLNPLPRGTKIEDCFE